MFLLCFILLKQRGFDYDFAISGNWTEVSYINDFLNEAQSATYILNLKTIFSDLWYTHYKGTLSFRDEMKNSYILKSIKVCGYRNSLSRSTILMGSWTNDTLYDICSNMSFFRDIFDNDLSNDNVFKTITSFKNSGFDSFRRFVMKYEDIDSNVDDNYIYLPLNIRGNFTSIALSYFFTGRFLRIPALRAESTKFCVIIALIFLFSHLSWFNLRKIPKSYIDRNLISITAMILMLSFDTSMISILVDKFITELAPQYLVYFLIIVYLALFIVEPLPQIIRSMIAIPKQSITISTISYIVLSFVSIFICTKLTNYFSIFQVLFAALPWSAQIFLNFSTGFNISPGISVLIYSSLSRILFFGYCFLYKLSIFKAYSPGMFILVLISLTAQTLALIFQKHLTDFILLTRKPKYTREKIPQGATCPICLLPVTMGDPIITPCKHCLHYSCLKQWLEHKYTCPICRAELTELPPLAET